MSNRKRLEEGDGRLLLTFLEPRPFLPSKSIPALVQKLQRHMAGAGGFTTVALLAMVFLFSNWDTYSWRATLPAVVLFLLFPWGQAVRDG